MAVGVRGLLLVRMERDDRSAAGTTFCPCSPPPPPPVRAGPALSGSVRAPPPSPARRLRPAPRRPAHLQPQPP